MHDYPRFKLPVLKADDISLALLLPALIVLAASLASRLFSSKKDNNAPRHSGLPFVGSWAFFFNRYNFIRDNFRKVGPAFRVNIRGYDITVVSGDAWRKKFLSTKEFEVQEASTVLNCFPPEIVSALATNHWDPDHATAENNRTNERLISMMHEDTIGPIVPQIFADLDRLTEKWGQDGTFWPFEDLFNIVVHVFMRQGGCAELASDDKQMAQFSQLYWSFMKSNTPTSVLLPWRRKSNERIGVLVQISQILHGCIQGRVDARRVERDAVQMLLDKENTVTDITQFVMMLLIAGAPNTATMTAWLPYFLHANPEWKSKAITEVRNLLATLPAATKMLPLHAQLASISSTAWMGSTPVLDACLRETIRMVLTVTFLRRNRGDSVEIDGSLVDAGSFMAYQAADVHQNERFYPEPNRFDPGRYLDAGKLDGPSFLGWGGGRHPCLGMRFAKLEIKCISAFFLMKFDYQLVDSLSRPVNKAPEVDRNHLNFNPPAGEKIYIRYKRLLA